MMKMKESYGLCPYLAEMERESLRNARIRNKEREKEETDIPEKLIAHIRRRKEKPTKNRWISLAADFEKKMKLAEKIDPEKAKRYLQMAREEVSILDRREKERKWTRNLRSGRIEIAT